MIDRYDPAIVVDGLEIEVVMEDHQRGDYVKFDEYEEATDRLSEQLEEALADEMDLKMENLALQDEINRLKQLLDEV